MSLAYLVDLDKQWYGVPSPKSCTGYSGLDRMVWAALFYVEDSYYAHELAVFVNKIFGVSSNSHTVSMSLRKMCKQGYVNRDKTPHGYIYKTSSMFNAVRELWV